MNRIYTLLLLAIVHISCSNVPPGQSNGRIIGKWLPVKSVMSGSENGKKTFEKTDSSFSEIDVMDFKEDGHLDDGGQRYESYILYPDSKELTLLESTGDAVTFKIHTLNPKQMILVREDDEDYRNNRRHMRLEIHFKRL
ncbi:hypothetical protein FHW36_102506 [Chitinophaga polysaccharea]|uniref:Lipocalin-like protein n=1 Tax=Chitinophaga polysaccharea TaxID=1293035 RepID=A0A561PXB6_9BACT|nr:hypothetical protein [Chitinophaga polysaccharea]TWF42745.1 hypothetical protein FHW36_102506 [Chitinophaga polysaccharea]